jgi:hypothetical protein
MSYKKTKAELMAMFCPLVEALFDAAPAEMWIESFWRFKAAEDRDEDPSEVAEYRAFLGESIAWLRGQWPNTLHAIVYRSAEMILAHERVRTFGTPEAVDEMRATTREQVMEFLSDEDGEALGIAIREAKARRERGKSDRGTGPLDKKGE